MSPESLSDSITVLIVDDEPELVELYVAWLNEDFRVKTAYSGQQALDRLDETVDVVLLDRLMSNLSGDDVLSELRKRDLDCRVAMVTAVEPDFDILEMGFDAYLTKPASEKKLKELIESLVNRSQYDRSVQEYYNLVSKRALLEAKKEKSELVAQEQYHDLQKEIDELEDELGNILSEFEDTDYTAQLYQLERSIDSREEILD